MDGTRRVCDESFWRNPGVAALRLRGRLARSTDCSRQRPRNNGFDGFGMVFWCRLMLVFGIYKGLRPPQGPKGGGITPLEGVEPKLPADSAWGLRSRQLPVAPPREPDGFPLNRLRAPRVPRHLGIHLGMTRRQAVEATD